MSSEVISRQASSRLINFGLAHIAEMIPPTVGRSLRWSDVAVFSSDFGFEDVVHRDVRLVGVLSRDDLAKAREIAAAECAPAGEKAALAATNKLRTVARQRETALNDRVLADLVYAEELARFPVSAIEEACRDWMSHSPFWPALSELLEAIDRRMAPRRALLRAIERKLAEPEEPTAPEPPVETREERLTTLVQLYVDHGQVEKAAPIERELAALQGREPMRWAMPKPVPEPAPAAQTGDLQELARQARARLIQKALSEGQAR